MYPITFDEIQCFLSVSRHKSFTLAAKLLFLTQPTITKQIKRLEKKLDLQLFYRNSQGVSLTEEGSYLFDKWAPLFDDFLTSIETAHTLNQKDHNTLKIAALEGMGYEDLLSKAIKEFEDKYPSVQVQTIFLGFYELNSTMDDYDVVFSSTYELENRKDFSYLFMEEIKLVVSMSSENPLRHKKSLSPKDLSNETLLTFSEKVSPYGAKHIREFMEKHDIAPKMKFYDNISSLRMSVILNRGITISNMAFQTGHEKEIVVRNLFPVPHDLFLVCCWKLENFNSIVMRFTEFIKNKYSKV